jgi:CheY-like chemotaxis protein
VRSIYPSLPLVIASGQSKKELRQLFKDMTLVSLVSKPYTAEELKNAVRAIGIRC